MDEIRLLIVEDETTARQALARLIDMEDDIQVVGQAGDGKTAVDMCRKLMPDVILMDIRMPVLDGISATQQIKKEMPNVHIVILTIYYDDASVFQAIKAGASGYVLKDSPLEDTIAAIRAAYKGDAILHPAMASRVIKEFTKISNQRAEDLEIFSQLTDREKEVLKLVANGKRNKEIADELFISEKTVKNHISNILFKLQANDRTEAAIYAAKHGLVDLSS